MKILLSGATGFVGSAVIDQLAAAGHTIRILARDPVRAGHLRQKYNADVFHGNILHAKSLAGCAEGMDAVVHIVGVIAEVDENTFERVHTIGTQNLLAEAKKAKVKRFIHMSALGTRANARSKYHQTKWEAEEAVRASGLDWTIFRPSIIYGPDDEFVNLFACMMRQPWNALQLFTLPVVGGGWARLQPVPVADVARCVATSVTKPEASKKVYDLCGPSPLRFREILQTIAETLGHDTWMVEPPLKQWIGGWSNFLLPFCIFKGLLIQPRIIMLPVPSEAAKIVAWINETVMTKPLLNRDQLLMLEEDNVGDPSEAVKDFDLTPIEFHAGIRAYVK